MAAQNGIDISSQKARKLSPDDFDRFDKIFVMDRSNLRNVKKMALTTEDQNKVTLFLENEEYPILIKEMKIVLKRFMTSLTKAVINGVIHYKKPGHYPYPTSYSQSIRWKIHPNDSQRDKLHYRKT